MSARARIPVALLVVMALAASTTACTVDSWSSSARDEPTCSDLLDAVIQYERSGAGDVDSAMQSLSESCSDDFDIAVDYISTPRDTAYSTDSCEELLAYGVRSEAVDLLAQDGDCTYGGANPPVAPAEPLSPAGTPWPEGGLGWDEAGSHAGTVQRVCGPLMSVRGTDDGTFVNVGQDYPSINRFTFVFWDIYLDTIDSDAVICGTGEIYLYDGVAQLEMWDPTALEIWR